MACSIKVRVSRWYPHAASASCHVGASAIRLRHIDCRLARKASVHRTTRRPWRCWPVLRERSLCVQESPQLSREGALLERAMGVGDYG